MPRQTPPRQTPQDRDAAPPSRTEARQVEPEAEPELEREPEPPTFELPEPEPETEPEPPAPELSEPEPAEPEPVLEPEAAEPESELAELEPELGPLSEELFPEEDLPEYVEETLGDESPTDAASPLSFEEAPEDIWSEDAEVSDRPEAEPSAEAALEELSSEEASPHEAAQNEAAQNEAAPGGEGDSGGGAPSEAVLSEAEPSQEGSGLSGEGSIFGTPTAQLLEYLKSLSEALPPEKQEEFRSSGLEGKIDGLIESLSTGAETEEEGESPQEPSLLASGERKRQSSGEGADRAADPRRSPSPRRSGTDRRADFERRVEDRRKADRRGEADRREGEERRRGERRVPPPLLDFAGPIPPETASVVISSDGLPMEIAGVRVSPRLAKLIDIMRRDKGRNID